MSLRLPFRGGATARAAVALFATTALLHASLVLLSGIGPFHSPDSHAYHEMAVRVSRGDGISFDGPYAPSLTLRSFRSPSYAVLAEAIYAAAGPRPGAVVAFQVLLAALLTVIVYLWTRSLMGEKDAIIAGARRGPRVRRTCRAPGDSHLGPARGRLLSAPSSGPRR